MWPVTKLVRVLRCCLSNADRTDDVAGTAKDRVDFERDPARFAFDLGLHHYAVAKQEVERAIQRIDQNYTYLVTVAAAVLASQIAFSGAFNVLDKRPWVYLLLAFVSLWFPINHTLLSVDLAVGGSYLRWELLPSLSAMAESAIGPTAPPVRIRQPFEEAALKLARSDWESHRSDVLFAPNRAYAMLNVLWFVKGLLLYAPSLAFIGRYVDQRLCLCVGTSLPVAEYALLTAIGLVSIVNQIVNWKDANLPRIARTAREGP
jgi:hypothetical protein